MTALLRRHNNVLAGPDKDIRILQCGYTLMVYAMCMSRTNIDIDDNMVAEVMRRFALDTKKSAVELALRRLLDATDQAAVLERTFGAGWEGDLEEIRRWEPRT